MDTSWFRVDLVLSSIHMHLVYVKQGVLRFLLGSSAEAVALRRAFVFKIVPMLNPDGVICGNYRSSLAGCDLNRRWDDPSPTLHPTIFHTKQLVQRFAQDRTVVLFCDLHGHSRRFNIFSYGCAPPDMAPADAARARLFPLLLYRESPVAASLARPPLSLAVKRRSVSSATAIAATSSSSSTSLSLPPTAKADSLNGRFSMIDCAFAVQASKAGTGRVVCWTELGIANSYTLEASFCGAGNNVLIDARCAA